jgi:hypothetical protein
VIVKAGGTRSYHYGVKESKYLHGYSLLQIHIVVIVTTQDKHVHNNTDVSDISCVAQTGSSGRFHINGVEP